MTGGLDLMYSKLGPIGACIYCGVDSDLSDEHVIPFALDGNIVLVKASCRACATETAKFEGIVARTIFGNIRMRYGFPTRRPKERLDTLPLVVERAGAVETIDVPIGEHPALTPILFFEPCGILTGYTGPERPILIRTLANPGVTPDSLDADGFRFDLKPSVEAFRRFLAKIAHCFAVLCLGRDGFTPWLAPLILTGEGDTEALIGGDAAFPESTARPDRSNVHQMLLRIYETKTHGSVCVVHIAMFANWFPPDAADRMPAYHVAVGAANDQSGPRLGSIPFYPMISQRVIDRSIETTS
jgi:hypothetical protein